jgi:hypothetical protein
MHPPPGAPCVVDRLELVEVQAQQRQHAAAPHGGQRLLQSLAEQHPVRQVGERIVVGEVFQFRRRRALLGDLFESGEPAVLHGLKGHFERAAAGDLPDRRRPLVALDQ